MERVRFPSAAQMRKSRPEAVSSYLGPIVFDLQLGLGPFRASSSPLSGPGQHAAGALVRIGRPCACGWPSCPRPSRCAYPCPRRSRGPARWSRPTPQGAAQAGDWLCNATGVVRCLNRRRDSEIAVPPCSSLRVIAVVGFGNTQRGSSRAECCSRFLASAA